MEIHAQMLATESVFLDSGRNRSVACPSVGRLLSICRDFSSVSQ